MRFWQALVTGQIAAGFVWADKHIDAPLLVYLGLSGSVVLSCGAQWLALNAIWPARPEVQAALLKAKGERDG